MQQFSQANILGAMESGIFEKVISYGYYEDILSSSCRVTGAQVRGDVFLICAINKCVLAAEQPNTA